MSLEQLSENAKRFLACSNARREINNKCYFGGDASHQLEEIIAYNNHANCITMYFKKLVNAPECC